MSFVNSIGNASTTPPVFPPYSSVPTPQALARRMADVQDVQRARADSALADAVLDSSFRIARTRAIRAEILNSTYETPERIDKTVERLLDVIG
jgi:hypothetical protein